jgi:predicted MFS family arabinose efflux permease
VGVLFGVAFVVRCQRTETPLVRLDLLRAAGVKLGAIGMFVQNVAFFGPYWALVQHTINEWGWSAARAGIASIPVSLVSGTTAFATSRIADRVGPRPFVLASAFGQLFAFAVLWVWIGDTPSMFAAISCAALLGATSGLAVPSLASMSLRGLPNDQRAFGSAVNSMAQRIGATLGAALAITFVASEVGTGALRNTLVACAVAVAVTIPIGVRAGTFAKVTAR